MNNIQEINNMIIKFTHIVELLESLKSEVLPYSYLDVTVATTNGREWSFQSGDNSFDDNIRQYSHWATVALEMDSNVEELAFDILEELQYKTNQAGQHFYAKMKV